MTDAEKITYIREMMPATANKIYLNTGSVGPMSTILGNAIQEGNTAALEEGRASMAEFMAAKQKMVDLRALFAELVGAASSEIALTHHTTDGMNIISHGLTWQPGDEIVTTTLEHPGGLLPLYVLRDRYGVVVRVIDIPADISDDEVVRRFEAAISPRTRLLAFSHVAWNTGMRLPMEAIVAMAHARHVLCLVDAAQSVGAIPLDLSASGVDFYAFPAQKWLCGPEGVGGLYVQSESLNFLSPTFVGFLAMDFDARHDWTGYFMPQPDARRFETGGVYRPGIKAMVENMIWLRDTVGWDWIYTRISHLYNYARQTLAEISGVTIISPAGEQAGLVTFTVDGYTPAQLTQKFAEDNIILRYIQAPSALRISTGFYNTEADIDQFAEGLRAVQKIDPALLP